MKRRNLYDDASDKLSSDVRCGGNRSAFGKRNCSESSTIRKGEAAKLPVSRVLAACNRRLRFERNTREEEEEQEEDLFRGFAMTGSVAEKDISDRGDSSKSHSPESSSLDRNNSGKGEGCKTPGRSFSSERDASERGSKSWTPFKKGYGSERHGGGKHERSTKGSSLERDSLETSEVGRALSTKGGAKERDVLDRDAADRGEEHRSSFRRGLNCGRDASERREGAKLSFSRGHNMEKERSDRESGKPLLFKGERGDREGAKPGMFKGSGSEKEVIERGEGLKILSLKALDCEREGRGKAHHHTQFSPSSKGAKYERLIVNAHFAKGARSERDKSRREDGSKAQGRDLHRGSKVAGETVPDEKPNLAEKSAFKSEAKDSEDADKLAAARILSEGECARKEENLHESKESDVERGAKSVERGNSLLPEEGFCMSREVRRGEAAQKVRDGDNIKDCLTPEKSEREEGELDPEGDDVQGIVEGKTVESVQVNGDNLVNRCREVKEEEILINEKDGILEQTSYSPEFVTEDAGAKREGDVLGTDAEPKVEKETQISMEIDAPIKIAEEVMKDTGMPDVMRPREVEVEERDHENGRGEYLLRLTDVKDMMLSNIETQEGTETMPEIENAENYIDKAGTSGHLDSDEPVEVAMESDDRRHHKKQKVEKLEPQFLSLFLPDTSLSLGSPGVPQALKAPSKTRSMQSISASEAHSNGVTTSLSLSYSHPFVHNPSCSLTQTSLDNQEFSTASQQVSQGNDQLSHGSWQMSHGSDRAGSQRPKGTERRKPYRERPLYQQLLHNGNLQILQGSLGVEKGREAVSQPDQNGLKRSFGSEKTGGDQISHGSSIPLPPSIQQYKNNPEGSQGVSLEDRGGTFERHRSLQKDLQERPHCTWSSPSPSVGSWEKWSEQQNLGKGRRGVEREVSKLESGFSGRAPLFERNEDLSATRSSIYGEKVNLIEIVKDPVLIVAKKLSELPESYVDGLKESLKDMLETFEKREEFAHLQKILQRRTDLSTETLLRAHRAQLELLISMKTGIPAFLNRDNTLTTSAMVEIFLQTRCRNIQCQIQLPADDCECPICAQKNGFCSACMCVVCSKFDFDANTCRWVGCDFCMHWCHTDCGLRSSYIMPGQSIKGAAGTSEMQFRCMACGQKSELFGFVKDVFTTCAQDWGRDVLARELECVQRIFHGSEDKRGKQLCEKAQLMLSKLESRVDTADVCRRMLRFFTDGETEAGKLWDSSENSAVSLLQESNKIGDAIREGLYKANPIGMDQSADLEKARAALQTYDRELEEKRTEAAEIQYDKSRKKAEIEELESHMRFKQAESQMFQIRANEARREAEGLRRIVLAKCEKVKDEYASKILKLRLNETEERRKNRLEELQICERSAYEFNNMKTRVVADIHELLKKMEATKRQLL
ncbi:hypothetical protein O6H91_15G044700 [Diphasiastrum complanatum]|uniref:Uncharacterized protein n=1 Tax=Diphasiastrum complanatum TaxID=34168 RepID=A0ACC2BHU6_DIPCM|nr:hypothetical protein O6H91_15G044700 [Diphasiastrum complanatum]